MLGLRGGQDHDGDAPERRIGLDLREDLAAILPREVQVEQDEIRPGGVGMRPRPQEEGQGGQPILDHVQAIPHLALLEGFHGEANIAGIVLDQQDLDRTAACRAAHVSSPPRSDSVK